eukprot:s4311_g2.t1
MRWLCFLLTLPVPAHSLQNHNPACSRSRYGRSSAEDVACFAETLARSRASGPGFTLQSISSCVSISKRVGPERSCTKCQRLTTVSQSLRSSCNLHRRCSQRQGVSAMGVVVERLAC